MPIISNALISDQKTKEFGDRKGDGSSRFSFCSTVKSWTKFQSEGFEKLEKKDLEK